MATQITEALRYLSDYLKEENQRLDAEHRELGLRRTIDDAATRFSSLGPQSTVEEARSIYSDMLKTASSQKGGLAAIPTLSQLFGSSVDYIRQGKLEKQDEALRQGLSRVSGMDADPNLSGQGMAALIQAQQQLTQLFPLRTADGKSYQQQYKHNLKTNTYDRVGDPIAVDLAGFAEEWEWKKREFAMRSYNQPSLSVYQGKIMKNGREITVPLSFQGSTPLYFDAETGRTEVYRGEFYDMREPQGRRDARDLGIITKEREQLNDQIQSSGTSLAMTLQRLGEIPRRDIYEQGSDRLNKFAYDKVTNLLNTGELNTIIAKYENSKDPEKQKEALLLREQATRFGTAYYGSQALDRDANIIVTQKQQEAQDKIMRENEAFLQNLKVKLTLPQGNSEGDYYRNWISNKRGIPVSNVTPESAEQYLTPIDILELKTEIEEANAKFMREQKQREDMNKLLPKSKPFPKRTN